MKTSDVIKVTARFLIDLASESRILCVFLTSDDRYVRTSIIHDHMHNNALHTKKEADFIFWAGWGYWRAKVGAYGEFLLSKNKERNIPTGRVSLRWVCR
ncbi:DUF1353 domain-containing protein [Salmonella enterica subsp. diarizonae serovar 48:r:z]